MGPTFEVQLKYNLYASYLCFRDKTVFYLLVLVNFVFRRKICNFSNPCELRVFGN